MRDRLLADEVLWASDVVANCAMNRLRQLAGVNSYTRELGFNPLDLLLAGGDRVAWLDLCCGSGRALIQAGHRLAEAGEAERVTLVGVDLVDAFDPVPPGVAVELVCTSVDRFRPRREFDLVTCVHGLHYVGDKLGLLARAAGWLTPTGRLVADLDPASISVDGQTTRQVTNRLRAAGFHYGRRRVSRTGPAAVAVPYTYVGADDRAGPNYTGQPAVTSHYRMPAPAPRPRPRG